MFYQFVDGDYNQRRNNQLAPGNYQQRPAQPRRNYQQQQGQQGQQQQQGSRFGGRFERNHRSQVAMNEEDESIEDPDNLWATPSSDAVGSGDFGSFDENGIFRAAGAASDFSMPPLRPEEFGFPARASKPVEQQPAETSGAASFFFSSPVGRAAPEPVQAAPQSTAAIPQITSDTQWLYRDPSGHIQGPFSSVRMLEWYNGNYFPESLPLRREQDPFFEPLSMWKVKCAGQVPFAAYTQKKPEPPPVSPRVTFAATSASSSQPQTHSVSVDDWFTPKQPVVAPVANKPVQPRSVALESLFGNPVAPEKPASPDVMMPSASAWKKPQQAATTSIVQFGSIESEMAQMALAEKSQTAAPIQKPEPAETSKSWGDSSGMKKIFLSDILKETPAPAPIGQVESFAVAQPEPISASQAGWAKLAASPVPPLSAIQAEEANHESEPRQSAPSGSKSFADLVRSAGVASGNLVVTASQSPVPARKSATAVEQIESVIPVKPIISKPAIAPIATTGAAVSSKVSEWCQNSLANTPLAKLIDPVTCSTLLLDLPSPASILNFSLETLQPLLASSKASFDLAGFAAELATRKFGKEASEKINWNRLASTPAGSDFSFETVKRKKK